MEAKLMHLKILLPYGVFADIKNVKRIVVETTAGSYGILPRRLDCTAALVTGILVYETEEEGEKYVAVNEGILIKAGAQVSISVRHAIGNAPLGKLREQVEKEMIELDELEISARNVMAKLETGFLRNFQNLRR
ncbi:F0F1 ATP synthase subunit epsilon [Aequorivita viscosa]|uniref:ATP synthase epsilon chain n=1 Tax=Aequorivita viscosa TaxID=797419 RepID=A0A1M6EPF3_9FLAO|nr:F0F1 ATP synthase subunit epsilon [Aequorivita viscosa]SDW03818.1 F-type H+-transporting ATPase subunit epsilon [Aequorivita viscosa]SHI87248.1 F-type H+-transporting ATPase subunit epsilon [Aequorivita viscosa]